MHPRPTRNVASGHSSRRGAALVVVLFAVVLISLLVVAFFSSVSKELDASKTYASGASAKIYADAAVNLVISQLRAGTGTDDDTLTWTSQPGLIRQFDTSGNQTKVFKLYSSNVMVGPADFSPAASADQTPSDTPTWSPSTAEKDLPWNADPGLYTDLNRPAVLDVDDGTGKFVKKAKYPILNPAGLNAKTRVQGFDVAAAYGIPDREDWNNDGDKNDIGQIPMPVRWLYLLADGRFATAADAGDKTVSLTLPGGGTPAKDNPPVARIAFWTDDDTSRLNVNTASEGNFWTTQIAAGADDDLATNQVNAREYQRYPGHPATTSLSPALNYLTPNPTDLRNFIFGLSPKIGGRGSQFGRRYLSATKPVTPDNDRLYASIDELLFLPLVDTSSKKRFAASTENMVAKKIDELDWVYTKSTPLTAMDGHPYQFNPNFELDPDALDVARFFLTANSRSPEVNLFGRPRISLWPVDTRADHRSIHDELLAFATTVNSKEFYFQRKDPDSQTADYDGIPRNQKLLQYLEDLNTKTIPGFGSSFSSKYGNSDLEALRVNIFDWIRTVNLAYRDKAGAVKPYAWTENPGATGIRPPGEPGSGQVLPIKIGSVQGLGRFPTLSKGAFAIVREEERDVAPDMVEIDYRVVFLMETYVPMVGYSPYIPNYRIDVRGLVNAFSFVSKIGPTGVEAAPLPVNFLDGEIEVNFPSNFEVFTGRFWGGTQGFDNLFVYADSSANWDMKPRTIRSTTAKTGYPYVSDVITVTCKKVDSLKVHVGLKPSHVGNTSDVLVKVKDPGGNTITTHTLPFPKFKPVLGALPHAKFTGKTVQARVNELVSANSVSTGGATDDWRMYRSMLHKEDVVRGLELEHGDLRLLALHGTDTNNKFVPHAEYDTTAAAQAHSLLRAAGATTAFQQGKDIEPTTPATFNSGTNRYKPKRGTVVANTWDLIRSGSPLGFLPQVPSSISDIRTSYPPGDFTTGMASESDGPAVLKADEGTSSFTGLDWGMSSPLPYQNQFAPYDNRYSDAFSPNRQVSSAVQLGTLPAKAASNEEWSTLHFAPDLDGTRPPVSGPHDSLLLDLFWMPVIDPYPISEPFSTAGKINMNYQIAPFTYIDRSTSMLGALKASKIMAIPAPTADMYKHADYTPNKAKNNPGYKFAYEVDPEKTLLFFKERFAESNPSKNIFRSAAEICQISLVPKHNAGSYVNTSHPDNAPESWVYKKTIDIHGANDADTLRTRLKEFWAENKLTGDNVRETPYNSLYPRLTTQSNTYTVHLRVQLLQTTPSSPAGTFSDVKDRVTGEYRGSQTIQRYIDPDDPNIPDFAENTSAKTLYPYYRYQAKGAKQFVP